MSTVKLAIRVRPFTERELKSDKDSVAVVNVVDKNTVTITNVKVSTSGAGDSRERVRSYFADYTFDSSCSPSHPEYASQDTVFESIGRDVVACVSRGVSACVLAYGQSATGKTHTMVGTEAQPGLVPRLCQALLDGGSEGCIVTVSFLEIYNERVHDLLAGEDAPAAYCSLPRRRGNARKDLRVREHPAKGTYVQNLRRVAVRDSQTLLALVSEGARRRRSAATRRNPSSSRSHAILELATSDATLHLADLAGSEKASWEGCGGGRQKEGANINKSLVALSNVISALVSVGSGRGRFVPYRDSALTWLLKDCFTGGARTFIIATVSPSVVCYGESASTLRWAARSRQLPEAKLPPHPPQATRAALQAQLTKLFVELARNHIRYMPDSGKIVYEDNHWNIRDQLGNQQTIAMNKSSLKPEAHNTESPASSIASGSSDVISVDKKESLTNAISAEMDKLFGPSLERTRSGSDLKVIAPHRYKRRQYKSQEVLPIDKTLYTIPPVENLTSPKLCQELLNADKNPLQSTESTKAQVTMPVPILYDNQRAEIVASVTERLYSKLKKKEESTLANMESAVDKKIMEPLSELRICTNARQRLMELSQKAMRHKRRIGIPAYSQTRKHVVRVKDQSVDVQNDLQPYYIKERDTYTLHQDVGTETLQITPRCKEVAVGPKCGSVTYSDSSTVTDEKRIQYKNSFVMTDDLVKFDTCTQTTMVPPPRKKKINRSLSKFIRSESRRRYSKECSSNPVININISQTYPTDSDPPSDDGGPSTSNDKPVLAGMPPDLLTNHNSNTKNNDPLIDDVSERHHVNQIPNEGELFTQSLNDLHDTSEFPEGDQALPRVRLQSLSSLDSKDIENMIMGRNENVYPYNIVLSPKHERHHVKRTVKFKDTEVQNAPVNSISVASQTSWEWDNLECNLTSDISSSEKDIPSYKSDTVIASTSSDSTDTNKANSDVFVWKKEPKLQNYVQTFNNIGKSTYTPVYKPNMNRNRTSKAKMYREFLGLDQPMKTHDPKNYSFYESGLSDESSQKDFRQKQQFFEDKFEKDYYRSGFSYSQLERNVLMSCDRLEKSVNKYDQYLNSYRQRERNVFCENARSPREYLQHLIELRRKVVKEDGDNVESSTDSYQRVF